MNSLKIKSANLVYNGKFLKVKEVPYEDTNYEIVEMNNAVAVLIVNKELTKILLAKQYRPVYGDFTYEIPAGMLDIEGENNIDCTARETLEEVNLSINPDDLVHLIDYMPIIGSVNHKLSLYWINVKETKNSKIKNDDVVERLWVDLANFENMINQGEIVDGKTLLAYYIMKDKLKAIKIS